MNWEIFDDDVISLSKYAEKYHSMRRNLASKQWKEIPQQPERVFVISDGTTIEDFLLPSPAKETLFVSAFQPEVYSDTFRERTLANIPQITLETCAEETYDDTAFVLLIDANKCDTRWFDILSFCAQKVNEGTKNKLLVAMVVPPVRTIPNGITKLQEREYAFFLEKVVQDHTDAELFTIRLEAACREAMKVLQRGRMTCLRFDNIFGSTGTAFPAFDLKGMVTQAFEDGYVTVTKEDRLEKLSCIYGRDAAMCVTAGLYYGKHGHVYNATRYSVTVANIKETLSKMFPDRIAVKTDGLTYCKQDVRHHSLSPLKFLHEQVNLAKWTKTFEMAFYATVCAWMDIPFDVISRLTCYEGKLNRLKSAEIDILREIDRICRKHNIQYFLAGGSCLGAIRENKSIPWDDDLDIGMLREDIDKFRQVAPQELGEKYVYSSPLYDENCHYYFDKIRLRDTYFSTFYSNKFVLDDGVFVDIVVYDQTSPRKGAQHRQIRWLHWMVKAINLRWHGYPVGKGRRRKLAKRLLPIMNRIPFRFFHKYYDRLATRYAKRKDAEFVLDGGTHLTDGPFSRECIRTVEYTTFDGMENAPIPTGYDEYLSFLYSPNYRPAPPLSSRLGAHKIARLDLGKYLFSDNPDEHFRAVDIRGELFETEEET